MALHTLLLQLWLWLALISTFIYLFFLNVERPSVINHVWFWEENKAVKRILNFSTVAFCQEAPTKFIGLHCKIVRQVFWINN